MKEVGDGCDASDVDGAGEAGEDALEELPGEVEAGGRRRVWALARERRWLRRRRGGASGAGGAAGWTSPRKEISNQRIFFFLARGGTAFCLFMCLRPRGTATHTESHHDARADLMSVRTRLLFLTTTPACHSTKPVCVLRSVPFMLTCGAVGSGWFLSQHQPWRDPFGSCAGAKHISSGQNTKTLHGM